MSLIVVTGGVRSGKSQFAEELALTYKSPVLYAATGKAWDDEMKKRIQQHQIRRPADWGLVEIRERLDEVFPAAQAYSTVLIDCLSNWISHQLMAVPEENIQNQEIQQRILTAVKQWGQAFSEDERTYIVVTNEVGLGGVAWTSLGRWFADTLGEANQFMAKQADQVYWVVSGIPVRIKG